MNERKSSTKQIAFNGILTALVVIILYLENVLPVNKLSLYTLSSFFIAVVVIEFGMKNAWGFYIASALLALIVVPEKAGILPYVVFFGVYGIVKFYIEKMNRLILEYILKFLYFNVCVAVAVFLIKEYFMQNIDLKFPWWVILMIMEVVFLVYDYVYTLFIRYYHTKLRPILKI